MRVLLQALITTIMVTASAYTPSRCEGGPMAADGTAVRPGATCAVSVDLRHLLGRMIHIEGVGPRRVNDVMHQRHRMSVDVAVKDYNSAREFGRQKVEVRVK